MVGFAGNSAIFVGMSEPIIAIQGEDDSFHDIAARHYFPDISGRSYHDSFEGVFHSVANEQADYGVSAIENSFAGSINQVYDLLLDTKLTIIGEVYEKIELCLIVHTDTPIDQLTEVYSHPVALAQAKIFLDKHAPQANRLEHPDTAGAVEHIASMKGQPVAAVANIKAAEQHNMHILARGIEANQNTFTRFIVIAREPESMRHANKTSLVLTTSHKPGALYHALGAFADSELNLLKLQSRPVPDEPWRYMFYVDVEAGVDDTAMQNTLASLTEQECRYVVLGSYEKGKQYRAGDTA